MQPGWERSSHVGPIATQRQSPVHLHRVCRVAHVQHLEAPARLLSGSNEHQVAGHGHVQRHPGGIDFANDGQKLHGCHLGQGSGRYLDHQVHHALPRRLLGAHLAGQGPVVLRLQELEG